MNIHIITCMAANRAIGYNNQLLYHIPEDMKRFWSLTIGHVVVMGRKTYESLPHGALPDRINIVLSHQDIQLPHCQVCHSLQEAISLHQTQEIFIIGGAAVYKEALPLADYLHLTVVDDVPPYADTYFPQYERNNYTPTNVNVFIKNNRKITFLFLKRINITPK